MAGRVQAGQDQEEGALAVAQVLAKGQEKEAAQG